MKAIRPKINRRIGFGVGSFTFRTNLRNSLKIEDLVLDLTRCLNSIPGLSDLRIEPEFDAPREIPSGDHKLHFLNISFDIDLSTDPTFIWRIQKFRFIDRSFFDVPVTAIVSNGDTNDPSHGVFLVRKYIEKYIRGNFEVGIIGPSPFHAEFFLLDSEDDFQVRIERDRGYDRIYCLCGRKDVEGKIEEFFSEIGHELNLFYLIHDLRAEKLKTWMDLEEQLESVEGGTGLLPRFRTWFAFNSRIGAVMRTLINFERKLLSISDLVRERYTDTYNSGKKFIPSYVDDARVDYKYPTSSVKKLIDFQTAQRSKFNSNLVTVIATVVGVLLTAAITYLFYKAGVRF